MATPLPRALALGVFLLATAAPAAGQEIRPTLDKVKSTGVIHLGYRETSRPFSFAGPDGQPAGYSVDLCLQVAGGIRQSLKLADLNVAWEPVPARVIASEPRADISVIQVSVVPRDAVVAKLADSDAIRVGDPVFIVGAPYGLAHSLSAGIISARWEADTVTRDFPLAEFFQTDAVINTGNSGGPMFTRAGELIGIVSHNISKSGGSEGLGFVVISNTVRKLLLERNRRWYGLDLLLVTGDMAEALKVPQAGGFLVKQVVPDSVAGRLGLRGGDRMGIVDGQQVVVGDDILLSAQGIPITSNADMVRVLKELEALQPGQDLKVTVLRDEKVVELSMKWMAW